MALECVLKSLRRALWCRRLAGVTTGGTPAPQDCFDARLAGRGAQAV